MPTKMQLKLLLLAFIAGAVALCSMNPSPVVFAAIGIGMLIGLFIAPAFSK